MILDPREKYCLTIDEYGIIQQHMIFKGFDDSKGLLDRSQYFKVIEGKIFGYVTKKLEKIIQ